MKIQPIIALLVVLIANIEQPVFALKTDSEQPATLDADEFDLDFQSGVRTYRGNVVYQQGTLRLYADEIVVYFKDDELDHAIASGRPAKFKQRPDDADTDVVGTGMRINMNNAKQIIILQNSAKVIQGSNTISGKKITYDMATEKVKVRSGSKTQATTTAEKGDKVTTKKSGADRPRLIIQPRKKKN